MKGHVVKEGNFSHPEEGTRIVRLTEGFSEWHYEQVMLFMRHGAQAGGTIQTTWSDPYSHETKTAETHLSVDAMHELCIAWERYWQQYTAWRQQQELAHEE